MTRYPTPGERAFLRGIAAVNPMPRVGDDRTWWSAQNLRTAWHQDFGHATLLSLAATGRSAVRKGMARRRHIGTFGHGWEEYRITSFGRGLVADSCIGGGLPWSDSGTCPACKLALAGMTVLADPDQVAAVPAHPLPGYVITPGRSRVH